MNRRDQFLRDQDDLRRRAQKDHARKVDRDARDRQSAYHSKQGERDERIQANIAEREWNRRNDDHKKSVFQAELHNARLEQRPPIYSSFLDVPDLEKPKQGNTESPWGSLLLMAAIAIFVIGGVLWTFFHYFGGLILGVAIGIGVAYVATTGIWMYLTQVKKPSTPEEVARADAWNPVTLTRRGLGLFRRGRQTEPSPGPQFQQNAPQQPTRAPAQPHPGYFDQEPEPEVYRPQYFDPQTGQTRPPGQ